jgi:Flp pilus assembly protein TadG
MTAAAKFAHAWICHLARNQDGIAAIEFAAILPFMLILYLGGVEVIDVVIINLRITNTVQTIANLTTQYSTIANADMNGILSAAGAVMAPVPATGLTVTVSEVTTDASGRGTVTWSDSLNGSKHAVGQAVTLPPTLQTPNTTFIWSQASYSYTPPMGFVLNSALRFSDQMFMYPRLGTITRVNS